MQLLTPALGLIFWTTLIFLVVLYLLRKFAWKPILKALDDREQTIDDALEMAGSRAEQIGAVAIDTFWHSLMGVDATNRPLTELITWEDTRPHKAAVELRSRLDEEAIHARTGARFHASYWPAKLHWLATQQSDTFSRVAQWLSFGEYLYRRFLGRDPDAEGLTMFVDALRGGATEEQVLATILGSDEYFNRV